MADCRRTALRWTPAFNCIGLNNGRLPSQSSRYSGFGACATMADWEQDKRQRKRVCLDHTLQPEVFSNSPAQFEPHTSFETTTDLCNQIFQNPAQRLPSLTQYDAWRDEDHDEQCQDMHTQCNGGAYKSVDQMYDESSTFFSGPIEAAGLGVKNVIQRPHAYRRPLPSQQYISTEQHAAYSMPHESRRPFTSDSSIAQNTTLINYSSSQSNNTIFIPSVASLAPSESQAIPSGPNEVLSGLPKEQVCFGMVGYLLSLVSVIETVPTDSSFAARQYPYPSAAASFPGAR